MHGLLFGLLSVTSFFAVAYADIVPVLSSIAGTIGKSHKEIIIFDPFYCQGSVRSHLAALGFTNVINKKQVQICGSIVVIGIFGLILHFASGFLLESDSRIRRAVDKSPIQVN